jgi:hypothetical protein
MRPAFSPIIWSTTDAEWTPPTAINEVTEAERQRRYHLDQLDRHDCRVHHAQTQDACGIGEGVSYGSS